MDATRFDARLAAYSRSIDAAPSRRMLPEVLDAIHRASERGGKTIIVGNGGSSAVASHVSTDLAKTSGLRVLNLNDPGLITCFGNDYGYERWVAEALRRHLDPDDVAMLISSSGRSDNMIEAARAARAIGATIITLTGFDAENPLRALGDLNLWVDAADYNVVEITHLAWLLAVVDVLAESATA